MTERAQSLPAMPESSQRETWNWWSRCSSFCAEGPPGVVAQKFISMPAKIALGRPGLKTAGSPKDAEASAMTLVLEL